MYKGGGGATIISQFQNIKLSEKNINCRPSNVIVNKYGEQLNT
jgi:hypothetical protein